MEDSQKPKRFMNIELNEDVETYTIQQVMELLDVSRKTVYNLAEKGHLQIIEYPYHTSFQRRYTKSSVAQYLENREKYVPIIKIANEFGVIKQKVFNLAITNNLPYSIDEIHFKRKTAVVTKEVANQLRTLLENKETTVDTSRKSDFVYNGYALYQPFIATDGAFYRLFVDENDSRKKWGFYVNNTFLPFAAARKSNFEPVYHLSDQPAIKSSYAVFECVSYDNNTRHFLDLLYQQVGIRNLYVHQLPGGKLGIHVKDAVLIIEENTDSKLSSSWIEQSIVSGEAYIEGNELHINGSHKIYSKYMSIKTIRTIEQLAAELDISSAEVIDMAVNLLKQQH